MSSAPLTWMAPYEIGADFTSLTFYSTLLGIAGGLILASLFKTFRHVTKYPIHEIILIFVCGFMTYLISEMLKLSAIVSLLACGICLSHYAWYNLSPQRKQNSSVTVEAIGFAAEAFVFVYIGLTSFSYNELEWCLPFCVCEILVAACC